MFPSIALAHVVECALDSRLLTVEIQRESGDYAVHYLSIWGSDIMAVIYALDLLEGICREHKRTIKYTRQSPVTLKVELA